MARTTELPRLLVSVELKNQTIEAEEQEEETEHKPKEEAEEKEKVEALAQTEQEEKEKERAEHTNVQNSQGSILPASFMAREDRGSFKKQQPS